MTSQGIETPKRRPRRVASDEAHAWARNLRLGNPYAKLVLSMLTLYVDAEGRCFVGIPQLAEDVELSEDTVRKRLAWLEEIGAIARFPQWIDASGRRNSDARGKRTSDEIRLLIDADIDTIEARARGEFSPRSQQGLNHEAESGSTAPALGQPSHYSEGLTSEPEGEDSPQKPLSPGGETAGLPGKEASEAGGSAAERSEGPARTDEKHDPLEGLERFKATHPRPSQHPDVVAARWTALSAAERARAQRGAEGVKAYCAGNAKLIASVVASDKFLANPALWDEFARYAPPEQKSEADPRRTLEVGSREYVAVALCCKIAGRPLPRFRPDGKGGHEFEYVGDLPAGAEAMAALATVLLSDDQVEAQAWQVVRRGTPQFAAWRDRVAEWLGVAPEPKRFWLGYGDRIVEKVEDAEKLASGIANSCEGLLVPETATGFPPAKGSAAERSEGPARTNEKHATGPPGEAE